MPVLLRILSSSRLALGGLVGLWLTGFVLIDLPASAHAQDAAADRPAVFDVPSEPAKWGDVSAELLRTNAFPPDSNAAAVILSDAGEARFRFNGEVQVKHHTRVKILNEGGYDWGTVEIPYYADEGTQRIVGVEGATYTLSESGEVVETELDKDDVFVEELDGKWEQVKFTLPNLTPGAVVEYRYKLRSKSFLRIPSWTFQHAEPTLYSAYETTIPEFLKYVTLTRGAQDYTSVDERTINSPRFSGKAAEKRWVMTDVPALREEPYMTTPEDFRSRIQLQVSRLVDPRTGVPLRTILGTWPETAEELMTLNRFGDDLGKDRDLRRQTESLTTGLTADADKIAAVYRYVQTSVEWTGQTGWLMTQDFDDVLASKQGTTADANLLLVSMLQHAGIEARPALTSTRSHGKTTALYPILEQFNYILAAVPNEDGGWDLLDATDRFLPPGTLPVRALNGQAWVVDEDAPAWVRVAPAALDERSTYANLTLSADGSVSGSVTVTHEGYAAASSRRDLTRSSAASFAESAIGSPSEGAVSDVEISHRSDLQEPLRASMNVSIPAFAQTAGDMLYVNPMLVTRFSENPFTQQTRTFPVDFAYPSHITYTLSMTLPEGYEVQETPQNKRVGLPQNAGSFVRLIQVNGNQVTVRSVLAINAPVFPASFYTTLREFVDHVVAAESEPIVLTKTAAVTGDASGND